MFSEMDDSSSSDEDISPAEAAAELLDKLIDMKVRGARMTATDACVLAYWAVMAGAAGDTLQMVAKAPGDATTGRYSSHLDTHTDTNLINPDFYSLDVPVFSRSEGQRGVQPLTALPPQLVLEREIASIHDWNQRLEEYVRTAPPCYSEHPVVKSCSPAPCVPMAVYFDGVQYKKGRILASVSSW